MGFEGTTLQDKGVQNLVMHLRTGVLGGVIFFPRNIVSPTQTKELITFFKSVSPTPLWIALDQEGGVIQTLPPEKGFEDTLSPRNVARSMSPDEAKIYYKRLARHLSDLGFNLNFGVVLDLDDPQSAVIGRLGRSYAQEPVRVAAYGAAFVEAHKAYGITACLKHYPGHGLALADSHLGLVDITHTHQAKEREPFRLLIARNQAPMTMVAHLKNASMDKTFPASLSPTIIKKYLRQQDGFAGLVISDDLHMGAIHEQYKIHEAVRLALQAGCDLVILSNNLRSQPELLFYPLIRPLKYWLRTL